MPVLICYDISNDALRLKVANALLELGLDRINRSVFAGSPKEKNLKKLIPLLRQWMSGKRASPDDSLVIVPVQTHQIYEIMVLGKHTWEPEDLAGDVHTLIF